MKYPAATKRQNGLKMMTLTIQHHFSVSMIISAMEQLMSENAEVTKKSVIDRIRDNLTSHGYGAEYMEAQGLEVTVEEALELFPEFKE